MTPPVASSAEPPKRRRTTAKRVTTRPSPSAPAPDPALARDSLESTPKRRRKTTKRAPTGIPSGDAEPTVALGTEPIGDAPEAAIVIPTGRLEIDPTETNWVGGDHGISPERSDGATVHAHGRRLTVAERRGDRPRPLNATPLKVSTGSAVCD